MVWVWCGFGVGSVWARSGFRLGSVWVWCGFGVRMLSAVVWVWCGLGVGLVWVWSSFRTSKFWPKTGQTQNAHQTHTKPRNRNSGPEQDARHTKAWQCAKKEVAPPEVSRPRGHVFPKSDLDGALDDPAGTLLPRLTFCYKRVATLSHIFFKTVCHFWHILIN